MNPQCALSLTYQASLIGFPLKYYIAQGLETSFPIYNLSQAGLTLLYFFNPILFFPEIQTWNLEFRSTGTSYLPL